MKTAIIGSGITGAVLAREIQDSIVFEKDLDIGGRTSTNEFSERERFDPFSTFFSDKISYSGTNNSKEEFSLLSYLAKNEIDVECILSTFSSNHYYPKNGMKEMIKKILSKNQIFLSHKLLDISRNPQTNQWVCSFQNGKELGFDRVILTPPLPKSLACLKSSKCMSEWEDFISPFVEYKASTILVGIWKGLSNETNRKLADLHESTFFRKNEDAEYISIESSKFKESEDSLIVMIQFGQSFSSRNLERWVTSNNSPTRFAKITGESFFQKFFISKGFSELKDQPPLELFAFKKRYAAPDRSLWKKEDLHLSSELFLKYIELGRKHGIWLAGDWVFGARISRCALGATTLASQL
ncbi:MAG: FAD-dependent oxidoreductase [Leptospiraceae bacterium]|nr:FAD-dependent oxidoreductase [Leptospiraceae bacterium]MCK6380673.1 FAD-dependent oxidoreductase [Leptospiraceae bacterium]NUM41543.1 FAD-dependent oxidoreductase [Leptospiraceae bacterium]